MKKPFLDNRYTKLYFNIIERARTRDTGSLICEAHHVLPKCMGGTNDADNLVNLTLREHALCHILLIKMTSGTDKARLWYAVWCMGMVNAYPSTKRIGFHPSKLFAKYREAALNNRKGVPKTQNTKDKISKAKLGRKLGPASIKAKLNMSKSQKARGNRTEAEKSKISQALLGRETWMKTHKHTAASIQKMSNSQRGNTNTRGVKHSAQAVQNNREAQLRRIYCVINNKTQEKIQVRDLKHFCNQHDLAYQFFASKDNVGKKYQMRKTGKINSLDWTMEKIIM